MATILDLSRSDKNLLSFMKGITAAGMEDDLKAAGPFTLLAPVNLAFARLTNGDQLDNLIKQGNQRLRAILSLHILKGKIMKKDFRPGLKMQSLGGQDIFITSRQGEIFINEARILSKDRQGSNGVLHSIDCINLPAVVK